MTSVARWIVWAFWYTNGRWLKQPRHPVKYGTSADVTDPANHATFGEAISTFVKNRRYSMRDSVRWERSNPRFQLDGVGYVFMEDDQIAGIDLDKCVKWEHGSLFKPCRFKIDEWALEVLAGFGDCYAEFSPSLTGIKVFVRGKLDSRLTGRKWDRFGPGGFGAIEIYDRDRYFTVTGLKLPTHPSSLGNRGRELNDLYARLDSARKPAMPAPAKPAAAKLAHRPVAPPPQDVARTARGIGPRLSDATVLSRARKARNGSGEKFRALFDRGDVSAYHGNHSSADQALCNLLAFYSRDCVEQVDRLFRRSALFRPKWDERRGASTYGRDTVLEAVGKRS